MARLLIITVGVAGRVSACLEMARRARSLGHDVAFASERTAIGESIGAAGHAFRPIVPHGVDAIRTAERAVGGSGRLDRVRNRDAFVAMLRLRRESWLAGGGLDSVFADAAPDLVLIDSELHPAIVVTRQRKLPTVVLEYHLSLSPSPNVPPITSKFVPNDSAWSRLRCRLSWRALYLERAIKRTALRFWAKGNDHDGLMRRLCHAAGLAWGDDVHTRDWMFYAFPRIPHWLLTAPELDFPWARRRPLDYSLGPMVHRERADPLTPEQSSEVREVLEAADPRPLIVLTVGSILAEVELCKRVVEAVRGRPWRLVMAVGQRAGVDTFGTLPDNVRAFEWLPMLEALESAAVAVCHGGVATLNECAEAAVPMLVYSNGGMDRDGNASRIAFHGIGLRGDLRRDGPARIRADLTRLLEGESAAGFRERAATLRRRLRRFDGADRLATAIEAARQGRTPAE